MKGSLCAILVTAVQNGVAGICYSYALGYSMSAREGFCNPMKREACAVPVSDGSRSLGQSVRSSMGM